MYQADNKEGCCLVVVTDEVNPLTYRVCLLHKKAKAKHVAVLQGVGQCLP